MGQYISDREPSTLSSDRTVVTFSTIEFHEHAIILGDNPATCDGPSLEIDWTEIGSPSKVGIEEYEKMRSPRRIKDQLRMPSFVREEVLVGSGYSRSEIKQEVRRLEHERRSVAESPLKNFSKKIVTKARHSFAGMLPF